MCSMYVFDSMSEFPFPATRGHLPREATFAPNRRWPHVAGTNNTRQLSSYLWEYGIFYPNQYGFRPKHSTEYAALELIDRIINKMDSNEIPIEMILV